MENTLRPQGERRPTPGRRRKRRRRLTAPAVLAGILLFAWGFLLGRAGAAPETVEETAPAVETPVQSPDIEVIPIPPSFWTPPPAQTPTPPPAETPPLSEETRSPTPADGEDWALRLVNWENPLPQDFEVPELTQLRSGHAIDSRAYPSLQAMMDAARAAGLQPLICSSFRTWDKQEELFTAKTEYYLELGYEQAEAEEMAAGWVARPGTSEHQTGLAVDIVDLSYQLLDEAQEGTAVQQWLMAHCAEYGFILRYPTDKSGLTGVNYEPWHYRYVGETAARAIMDGGLCLEEYLSLTGGSGA